MKTSSGGPGARNLRAFAGLAAGGALLTAGACATVSPEKRSQVALDRATKLRAKNKLGEAAVAYTTALDADPTNLVALRGYVEIRHIIGQTGVAVARFRRAIALHPDDANAHEGWAVALRRRR